MDDETASKTLKVAKVVALRMKKALGCDGVNVLQNNEAAAGQTVFHFHMHLIPRYKNDSIKLEWEPSKVTEEELQELVLKIQQTE